MNTTLYQNWPEDTQNWTNLCLDPHDYRIYYVNIDLRHQYGISAAESQTFLLVKRPQRRRARRNGCFRSLRWRNTFQWSPFLGEELSSCGVDLACRTVFVVKDNNKLLDDREYRKVGIRRGELAVQNTQKSLHNFFIRIPSVLRRLFPFPWKDNVVSQQVMEWYSESAFAFLGPSASQMVSIDIYWKCFPMPKAIQTLTSGRIKHRLLYSAIAMTTTSVSTVLIRTFCAPCSTASLTCTNIRVSWDLKFESGVKQSLLVLTWCDYYVLVCREGVSANLKSVELEQLFLVSCIAQKWLPVTGHLGIFEVMMYKCINKLVPDYLIEKFTLRSHSH